MWVVYSLDPRLDLKPGDLRRELIEHSEDPSTKLRALQQAERRAESELERQVLRYLVQANHRVRTQWQVGHYRIDLVVEGDRKSTRLNSSHTVISYAVFCLKKKILSLCPI